MKKIYFCVFLILFIANHKVLASGDSTVVYDCFYNNDDDLSHNEYSLIYNSSGQILVNQDGTIYNYDSLGNLISAQSASSGYQNVYDSLNNLLSNTSYNIVNGVHQDAIRNLYQYNGHLRIQYLSQQWINGSWANINRTDYFYDINQNDSLEINYISNGITLIASTKKATEYHGDGHLDFDSLFSWNLINTTWTFNEFDTITYDSSWHALINLTEYPFNGMLEPASRYIYTYDTNGNQLSYSQDQYIDSAWEPISWGNSTYNSANQILTSYGSCEGCGYGEEGFSYDSLGHLIGTGSYGVTFSGEFTSNTNCNVYYNRISGPNYICEGSSELISLDSGFVAYSWSTGDSTRSITINQSGTYTATVLDSEGIWENVAPLYVTISYGAVATHASDSSIIICRDNPLNILVPGNPVYQYQWVKNDTIPSTTYYNPYSNIVDLSTTNLSSGCYRLIVTSGCDVDTSSRTCIQFIPDTTASITVVGGITDVYGRVYVCSGDTIMLTASHGNSYSWSPGYSTQQYFQVSSQGEYVVDVSYGNGCFSSASISVEGNQFSEEEINILSADSFLYLQGGPYINVSSSYLITWFYNGDTIPGERGDTLFNPLDGNYQSTIYYPDVCSSTYLTPVLNYDHNSMYVYGLQGFSSCANPNSTRGLGAYLIVRNFIPPLTFQWNPQIALSDPSIQNPQLSLDSLAPGSHLYFVTVTDSIGRHATDSCSIIIYPVPSPPNVTVIRNDTICNNEESVMLHIDPYANDYRVNRISGGCQESQNGNQDIFLNCAGTYSVAYKELPVTYPDPGCWSLPSSPIVVNAFPDPVIPQITTPLNNTICQGDSILIDITVNNNYSSYQWQSVYPAINLAASDSFFYATYTGSFRVNVSDSYGCHNYSNSINIYADTNNIIGINYVPPSVICQGDSVKLVFDATNYSGYFLQWFKDGHIIPNENDSVYYVKQTGYYNLYAYALGDSCASVSNSFLIQVRQSPFLSIVQNNNSIEAISSAWNFQWYKDGNVLTSDTTAILNVNNDGVYNVFVTDYHGCSNEDSIDLNCSAIIQNVNENCFGDCNGFLLATPTGLSPFSYHWSNGDTSLSIQNLCSGNYYFIISDTHGCIDTLTSVISQPNALNSVLNIDSSRCYNECSQVHLVISGGASPYSYQWCNGSALSSYTSCLNQTCQVLISDSHGCTFQSMPFDIIIPDSIIINASVHNAQCQLCPTGTINLNINGGTIPFTIDWTPQNGQLISDSIVNLTSGNYIVTVTDQYNCSSSINVFVPYDPLQVANIDNLKFNIYPNPATKFIYIDVPLIQNEFIWQIDDIYGKEILSGSSAKNITSIQIENFSSGLYFFKIQNGNHFFVKTIVVENN